MKSKKSNVELKTNVINKNILYVESFSKHLLLQKPLILSCLTSNMSKISKIVKSLKINENVSNDQIHIVYNLLLKILKQCNVYENKTSNKILNSKKQYLLKLSKFIANNK